MIVTRETFTPVIGAMSRHKFIVQICVPSVRYENKKKMGIIEQFIMYMRYTYSDAQNSQHVRCGWLFLADWNINYGIKTYASVTYIESRLSTWFKIYICIRNLIEICDWYARNNFELFMNIQFDFIL